MKPRSEQRAAAAHLSQPGQSRPSKLSVHMLLIASVALYCRPQGVSQFYILAALALLVVPVLLTRASGTPIGTMGIHVLLLATAVAAADYFTEGFHSFLIAGATMLVPLFAARVVVNRLRPIEFVETLERTILALLGLSLLAGAFVPAVGITQELATKGALRGLFDHRNTLGYVAMLGVAATVARRAVHRAKGRRFGVLPRAALYAAILVWAGSTTAIGVSILLVALARTSTKRGGLAHLRGRVVAGLLAGAILFPFFLLNVSSLLGLFNKESSFDGRLAIWQGTIEAVRLRPWVGYGRLNYLQPGNEFADVLATRIDYYARSAHNSFLALGAQSGVIIAVVGVALWVRITWGTLDRRVSAWDPAAVLLPMLALVFAIDNLVETRQFLEIGWFLMCAQAFMIDEARATDEPLPTSERTADGAPSHA